MAPRVNSIQIMKACWKRGYTYQKYIQVTGMFRVPPMSSNYYGYCCTVWTNLGV